MNTSRPWRGMTLAVVLTATLSACSVFEACNNPACMADRKISDEVRKQFEQYGGFIPLDVSVQTYDGIVYLYGLVEDRNEVDRAIALAKVKGAKEVRSEISVEGTM